jgi:hypothetical protein
MSEQSSSNGGLRGGHDPHAFSRKGVEARRRNREARKAAAAQAARDPQLETIAAAVRARIEADPHDVGAHVLGRLLNEAYSSSSATARVAALRELADHFSPRHKEFEAEPESFGPLEIEPGRRANSFADVIDLAEEFGVDIWARHSDTATPRSQARAETDAVNRMARELFKRVCKLRDGEAWKRLGFESWHAFAEAELGGTPSTTGRGSRGAVALERASVSGSPAAADNSPQESAVADDAVAGGLARFRHALVRAFSS